MRAILILIFIFSCVSSFAQPPTYIPQNGLIGWWPFNGNAYDESGHGNNGTVNGAVLSTDRFGNNDSAYEFNGISDFIDFGNNGGYQIQNQITMSVWFMVDSPSHSSQLIQFGDNANNRYCIQISPTSNSWGSISGVFGNYIFGSHYSSLSWHHVVFVCDRVTGVSSLFLDGLFLTETIYSGNNLLNYPSCNLVAGSLSCSNSLNFKGKLDEIGIWDRVLTNQEISDIFINSKPPSCDSLSGSLQNGLIAWYPFCGNPNDESGNGNNGGLNGGVSLTTDRFGNSNSAFHFDGNIGSYIGIFNLSMITNSATISSWVKVSDYSFMWFGSWQCVYFFGDDGFYSAPRSNHIDLHINSQDSLFGVSLDHTMGTCEFFSLDTDWQQITVVFDGINHIMNTYVNCNLLNTCSITADSLALHWSSNSLGGCAYYPGPFGNYFLGDIDDVGIWNRVLTQQEIVQLRAMTTSESDIGKSISVSVFPNPSKGELHISGQNTLEQITITNQLGQLIEELKPMRNEELIYLNKKGLYFINIRTKESAITRYVIIE
jgi:hypothetical protein